MLRRKGFDMEDLCGTVDKLLTASFALDKQTCRHPVPANIAERSALRALIAAHDRRGGRCRRGGGSGVVFLRPTTGPAAFLAMRLLQRSMAVGTIRSACGVPAAGRSIQTSLAFFHPGMSLVVMANQISRFDLGAADGAWDHRVVAGLPRQPSYLFPETAGRRLPVVFRLLVFTNQSANPGGAGAKFPIVGQRLVSESPPLAEQLLNGWVLDACFLVLDARRQFWLGIDLLEFSHRLLLRRAKFGTRLLVRTRSCLAVFLR